MNLFLKAFTEHFIGQLPSYCQHELAVLSSNPKILRNLALLEDLTINARLIGNPNTPTDALEHIVISTKNCWTFRAINNHRNATERIRRLIKMYTPNQVFFLG